MRESFRLGRIFGIPVGVNWTVIVIAALIAWSLAADLPNVYPGRATWAYWATAIAGALIFFASLLTHELAHSVVARRNGVEVDGITLWLLGGVSKLEGEATSAGAEFRIAVVGPLTSFVLALVFSILAPVASAVGLPDLVVGSLAWLALINFILAVFNLLPAYPLDGGRVLRALVWERNHDRLAATRTVARVSHYLAWALIGLGLFASLGGLLLQGVWLVLIGWFLDNAGRAEASMAEAQGALGAMRASELMSAPPVVAPAGLTVDALLHDYVLGRHHSAFPVVDETGRVLGLVTLADVRRLPPERRAAVTVGEVAVPMTKVTVVQVDEKGVDVLDKLRRSGQGRALVMDATGRLVGVIANSDLVRALDVDDLLRQTVPPAPPQPPPSGWMSEPTPVPPPPGAPGPAPAPEEPVTMPPGWGRDTR